MNHTYRHVWNELTRAWVAVAEIARGRGKKGSATVGHSPCRQRRLLHDFVESHRGSPLLVGKRQFRASAM